jgi:hypothetical protein
MPKWLKHLSRYLGKNWERWLFGLVGGACLILTFRYLFSGNMATGSALFAMSFFSFFYSNLARFKRFKGLGFEAELWEDKQKEAADLIGRLKNIVAAYTREIVMGTVMRGRLGGSASWEERWALFDELTGQHTELGQDIDFSQLKNDVDSAFIFDICLPLSQSLNKSVEDGKRKARDQINQKYGSPITDSDSYNADIQSINGINVKFDNLFERAKSENIAQEILDATQDAKRKLATAGVEVAFEPQDVERLESMAKIIKRRPIAITSELTAWANSKK